MNPNLKTGRAGVRNTAPGTEKRATPSRAAINRSLHTERTP